MMTEKPKIQYIGQFYVPGSEAQVLAPKKKKKKAKTKLPIAKQEQVKAIYIDPVALIGITVAVVMLAVMVVGALQLRSDWAQYEQMSNYVSRLNQNNAELERTYRDGYDLEDIRDKAGARHGAGGGSAEQNHHRHTLPAEAGTDALGRHRLVLWRPVRGRGSRFLRMSGKSGSPA